MRRMDSEISLKNWRMVITQPLISHPNVFVALFMMFADALLEVTLISTALKMSIPPIWIFLSLLGCQALSAPIQGIFSDHFSQKKTLLFACFMGLLFAAAAGVVSLDGEALIVSTLNLPALLPFTSSIQMLLILCGKGLFGNITVIARATIAEVIKMKTLGKI